MNEKLKKKENYKKEKKEKSEISFLQKRLTNNLIYLYISKCFIHLIYIKTNFRVDCVSFTLLILKAITSSNFFFIKNKIK